MTEDKLDTLLDQCKSPIERELLTQLYPHLPAYALHLTASNILFLAKANAEMKY